MAGGAKDFAGITGKSVLEEANMSVSSRDIKNMQADLAFCVSLLQNSPESIKKEFEKNKETFEEVKDLVSDLFSIFEAIGDAQEETR